MPRRTNADESLTQDTRSLEVFSSPALPEARPEISRGSEKEKPRGAGSPVPGRPRSARRRTAVGSAQDDDEDDEEQRGHQDSPEDKEPDPGPPARLLRHGGGSSGRPRRRGRRAGGSGRKPLAAPDDSGELARALGPRLRDRSSTHRRRRSFLLSRATGRRGRRPSSPAAGRWTSSCCSRSRPPSRCAGRFSPTTASCEASGTRRTSSARCSRADRGEAGEARASATQEQPPETERRDVWRMQSRATRLSDSRAGRRP